jgi:hypothetical protein
VCCSHHENSSIHVTGAVAALNKRRGFGAKWFIVLLPRLLIHHSFFVPVDRSFSETGVVVFSPPNKLRLLLSVLLFLNNARQILMIDLEDDRQCVSVPLHQNVSC